MFYLRGAWIGHDMNDEFGSGKIGDGYCVKVYSNIDFNKKPDRKRLLKKVGTA